MEFFQKGKFFLAGKKLLDISHVIVEMVVQKYDYLVVPALGLDTLTVTGRYAPPRRPYQTSVVFTTVEKSLHPFPQAILIPLPEL